MGNKADELSNRAVSFEEGKELASSLGIPFFEVSAKSGEDVEMTFQCLLDTVVKNLR